MRRLAVLSLHTSPLAQPGSGDGGGMNVYVRQLASALSQAGGRSTVFTRRVDADVPTVVDVEPGFRVVHVEAGAHDLPKEDLLAVVDEFADGVADHLAVYPDHDGILANYWLSGVAGHRLKHELNLPLITTFHTLARVKAETGDPEPLRRVEAETAVVGCSDLMLANGPEEADQLVEFYRADPNRIEIVPPGVDHAFFTPGSQAVARRATGLGSGPVLLFAGRIQPLKGVDVAVRALAELGRDDARLVVVGGASGSDGSDEERRVREVAASHGLVDRVRFVPPQPHHSLAYWYRAADVVVMPSRSESFDYAVHVARILDDPVVASRMSVTAAERSWSYTWSATAARLRRICDDLTSRTLVDCA